MQSCREISKIRFLNKCLSLVHGCLFIRGELSMHTMRRIVTLILAVLLLPVMVFAADDSVFIRIDRDDPDAWKEELANVRFLE